MPEEEVREAWVESVVEKRLLKGEPVWQGVPRLAPHSQLTHLHQAQQEKGQGQGARAVVTHVLHLLAAITAR